MKLKVQNLDYLKAAKKNQLAFLVTEKYVQFPKDTQWEGEEFVVRHERMVILNADYLKLENLRREKAGEEPLAKAGKLPWGEWEIPNLIITHNGQKYLRYYPYRGDLQYDEVTFYMNGTELMQSSELYDVCLQIVREKKGKPSVCRNVNVAQISCLALCKRNGDPEVDVIYEKFDVDPTPDEPEQDLQPAA